MHIRTFDWRDLPTLQRYRGQSVFLNSAQFLTRGPMLLSGALLSALAPGVGIFTSVSVIGGDTNPVIIGQTMHTSGAPCAQLTFLTPEKALESEGLLPLLDYLSAQAVEKGAFHLLADVDEGSAAFEILRQAGFAIYARQRIWRLEGQPPGESKPYAWQAAKDQDLIAVRSLYNNLVPGLVQQVEPFPADRLHGLVFRRGESLLAFVELKYGQRGVWVQPFIHPDAAEVTDHLAGLFQNLPHRHSRPVHVCVRSYQFWLEQAIEALGAEPGPRQAMMVRHLAVPQKVARAFTMPAIESGHPEASAPIAHSQTFMYESAIGEQIGLCRSDE
jgi:hypothetical protein